jgi:hypothetical protein
MAHSPRQSTTLSPLALLTLPTLFGVPAQQVPLWLKAGTVSVVPLVCLLPGLTGLRATHVEHLIVHVLPWRQHCLPIALCR